LYKSGTAQYKTLVEYKGPHFKDDAILSYLIVLTIQGYAKFKAVTPDLNEVKLDLFILNNIDP